MENILLDSKDELVLLDSGLSLRVPYCDPCNIDGVTDVSEGTTRRLMRPQGQCGQLMYLAPEILEQRPFDGHSTDMWAAAITLFIMLVGVAPFGMAQCSDKRFEKISQQGGLEDFLESLDVSLSKEAIDLLQNMMWCDPRDRATLAEVMAHPWVLGDRFSVVEVPPSPVKADSLQSLRGQLQRVEAPLEAPISPTSTMETVDQHPRKHRRKSSGGRDSFFGALKLILPKRHSSTEAAK